MAQENTHNQKMAELAKHKDGHIAYWKAQNKQTDPKRFEDGFIQGWCDAENREYPNINRDSMISQRKNENIASCGNSPNEWAFEHGYHEGFDSRRCLNTGASGSAPPQENTHDQKMAEMCKHRDGHIAYWSAHGNKPTDPKRFEDGFIQGWCDCEHNLSDCNITVNTFIIQRHQEHVKSHGDSPCEWAFDDGYREGFEARKCMISKPTPPVENTHEQKMAEMCKHKDAHIAYWKAHGNRPTDPGRFEDGFIQGWCDCEHHLSDTNITVNSLIGQRRQEHVKSHGDSPCEWAFDDGYREGFEGRRCMKPPQQPAPPPVTKPEPPKAAECPPTGAPNPAPAVPRVLPPTASPNPAPPTQPPAPPSATQPPVAGCPPTEAPKSPPVAPPGIPPTSYPVQPPSPTQPPAPSKPADCPPPPPPVTTNVHPNVPPVTPASPPTTKPADCPPPATPAPPTAPPVTPAPPTRPADCPPSTVSAPPTQTQVPPMTNAPGPNHRCTPACNHPPVTTTKPTVPPQAGHHCTSECSTKGCTHSEGGQPSTSKPAPVPTEPTTTGNHCHTDEADLPVDHHCTSECNHAKKKEGLLQKIEHALRID